MSMWKPWERNYGPTHGPLEAYALYVQGAWIATLWAPDRASAFDWFEAHIIYTPGQLMIPSSHAEGLESGSSIRWNAVPLTFNETIPSF